MNKCNLQDDSSNCQTVNHFNILFFYQAMTFNLEEAQSVLRRTPDSIYALVHGLSDSWTLRNEGDKTWNVPDVVAHLIYCDRYNWLLRARRLLETGVMIQFDPLDRSGGKKWSETSSLSHLLDQFRETRKQVLDELQELHITPGQYNVAGFHPEFGQVNLSQLLSAWVVHDLTHLSQINRILAHQYREAVGPWSAYLRILH